MTGMRRRSLALAGLALAVVLLVAGVVSGFASSSPDGLERVADDQGFAASAQERDAVGPLGGYALDGDDSRLGTGVAGVAGALLVLGAAGGLTWVLRRRSTPSGDAGTTRDDHVVTPGP